MTANLDLENGYAKAWFTWIEWITLTALLYVAGNKLDSLLLKIISLFSILLVFFVGLAAVERFATEIIPSVKKNPLIIILVNLFINITGLFIVFETIHAILNTFGS